jgi:hypothetical protein
MNQDSLVDMVVEMTTLHKLSIYGTKFRPNRARVII